MTKQREAVSKPSKFRPSFVQIPSYIKSRTKFILNVYFFSSEKIEIFTGKNLDNVFRTSKIIIRYACKSLQYFSMHKE